ncbi:MAG TPA: hypothetical protein DDW87_04475, partial [Firmicutes bacterium]|nr:hypothetical protein [Bacillota bacterium]
PQLLTLENVLFVLDLRLGKLGTYLFTSDRKGSFVGDDKYLGPTMPPYYLPHTRQSTGGNKHLFDMA